MADDVHMSQADIDALFAQMSGGTPEAKPAEKSAPASVLPAGDPVTKVEQFMAETERSTATASVVAGAAVEDDDESPPPVPAAEPVAAAPAAPEAAGPLSQSEIDMMLAALGGATTPEAPPSAPAPVMGSAAATAGTSSKLRASQEVSASGPLGQSDIDALLAQLGASAPEPAKPVTTAPTVITKATVAADKTGANAATLALSADALEQLVNKHDQGDQPPNEAMIAQSDIDALVQQLAGATGPATTQSGMDSKSMAQQLKERGAELDRAMANAPPPPRLTVDAVDVRQVLGTGHSPGTTSAHSAPSTGSSLVAQVDFRGARWLLVAAVLLLAVCTGFLMVSVSVMRTLADELRLERLAATPTPGDSYADDLRAGRTLIGVNDSAEQAKGVLLLERLKARWPSHEEEVALVLARHHRAHAGWRKAADEYALVAEGEQSDPAVYAEYAEVLARLDERDAAIRTCYRVLANEARWTAAQDEQGNTRPQDERTRARAMVDSAALTLARLLAAPRGDARMAAVNTHGAAPTTGGHEAPASSHKAAAGGHEAPASSHEAPAAAHGGGH